MNVSAKWTIVDGQPFVVMTLPGGFRVALPQFFAWQLKNELERVLATAPPRRPDNDQRED